MSEPVGSIKLARTYRTLLLAYPRSYRRERGGEILTTLMDAAPDDRARPTRAQVVDLLLGGVRHRFRVRGAVAISAAVIAAVLTAVAGGAFAAFLGWQTAPALPTNAEAARIVSAALPTGDAGAPRRWDFLFDDNPKYTDPRWVYLVGGTDEYMPGQVRFSLRTGAASTQSVENDVRARLRASGWRLQRSDASEGTVAYRDGWRIALNTGGSVDETPDDLVAAITRTRPGAVLPLSLIGLGVGAAVGWLVLAGMLRRIDRATPARRATTLVFFFWGAFALLPATAISAIVLVASLTTPDPVAPWRGYVFMLARPLALLGAAAVLGAIVAARLARPGEQSHPAIA